MEITLFDKIGKPIAYISQENDNAIYLWDGHSVCYLEGEKIYGWRGRHIGWFEDEIIYDTKGYRIGFTQRTCPNVTYAQSVKYVKHVKHVKFVKHVSFAKPSFSSGFSNMKLLDFLNQDRA